MVIEMELNWSAITLHKFSRRISAIHSSGQAQFRPWSSPNFQETFPQAHTGPAAIPDGESSEDSRREGQHIKSSLCSACLNIAASFYSDSAIRYPKRAKDTPNLQDHFSIDELVDCSTTCPLCSLIVASLCKAGGRPHLLYRAKAMLERREGVKQQQESMLEILEK